MAVSSLKGCWSKLSARIRDYIDVVDSYYRPSDDVDGPTSGLNGIPTKGGGDKHHQHRCGRKDCPMTSVVQLAASHHHLHHHHHHHHHNQSSGKDKRSCKYGNRHHQFTTADNLQQDATVECLSSRLTNQQRKQTCLSLGCTKRKTAQGQVYFVDLCGHKFWHDPSVPKELLNASLDLDSLVGRLSNNWEIKQTSSGRTYFINHTKKTTQFTDPRLVVYKDQLMNYLRRSTACLDLSTDPNSNTITVPNEQVSDNAVQTNAINSRPQNTSSCTRTDRNSRFSGRPDLTSVLPTGGQVNPSSRGSHNRRPSDEPNLAGGTLDNRRSKQYQKNLLRGSHHDLNTTTPVLGQSNTFTGPVPSWLKPLVSNGSRKQLQTNNHSANRNEIVSNNGGPVVATVTPPPTTQNHNNSHNNNYYSQLINDLSSPTYSTNITQNSHTSTNHNNVSNYDLSPPYSHSNHHIQQQHHNHDSHLYEHPSFDSTSYPSPYNEDNNRELFDKISILRQELLKQQVLSHPCRIDINRKRIFEESFRTISQMQPRDLKKRLLVKFRGEEGLDYGGVAREWFYLLSREILNPVHGLFQYTSDDIYNLQINPDSGIVYREHLSYMNFCGRVIGMAVFHGHFIEGRFTLPFYKMLLRKSITLDDIEFVDPDLHRSLCWILDNDITDIIDTTFLVQHNAFGQLQEHELKENGRNIVVTEANKHEYVSLYVNYRCRRGIESQFEALQRGFYELITPILVSNFNERELELLIGGLSKINIEDWRLHTRLKNCTIETPLVKWFWDIVKSYDEEKRARLLQFVTGSPRVPIQGFKALQGVNSELRLFTIHLIRNANTDNLPKSHTCFNRIDLPPYESYEKLRDKLTQAIEETMGFAMQ